MGCELLHYYQVVLYQQIYRVVVVFDLILGVLNRSETLHLLFELQFELEFNTLELESQLKIFSR